MAAVAKSTEGNVFSTKFAEISMAWTRADGGHTDRNISVPMVRTMVAKKAILVGFFMMDGVSDYVAVLWMSLAIYLANRLKDSLQVHDFVNSVRQKFCKEVGGPQFV